MKRALILAAALALAGCGTTGKLDPKLVIKKEEVPIAQGCPDKRPPPPVYPDTPAAIAAVPEGDLLALVKLLLAGRVLRDERAAESDAQIQACAH